MSRRKEGEELKPDGDKDRDEKKKKCTLAIKVLGPTGRQVLNSQLTLHLCVL